MINKKAQFGSLMTLALIIMVLIVGGIVLVIGSGILTFVGDTVNDVTSTLGVQGDTNLSHASDVSIGIVNNSLQMLKWGSGILLFFALMGILIFSFSIRLQPNGFMIVLYILMVLIFVMTAIYMSNVYEEFIKGRDDIASELKEMPMASFIILYMPHIITIIAFLGGVIIFSGIGEEQL